MSTTEATNVNPNLRSLVEAGTSPWLDFLSRSLVQDGELARLIAEESLKGVTSNPSIFDKAMLDPESDDYDEQLESARPRRASTPRPSTRRSPSPTSSTPAMSCATSTGVPITRTASSRSRWPPTWPTTSERSIEAARSSGGGSSGPT